MKILSAAEVDGALDDLALIDRLDALFRAGCEMPVRHHHDIAEPTGPGSAANLYAIMLKNALGGINMTPIPYKGNAPGLTDVVAGHVSVMFSDLLSALPLIRDGKLRALGVSTAQRSAAAPEIPTLLSLGVIIGAMAVAVIASMIKIRIDRSKGIGIDHDKIDEDQGAE